MKPSIPETGMVVKINNGLATIMLNGGDSCKNCSAGKLGICKPSGNVSIITATATEGINPGDTVKITLDSATQSKGMFLAFIIPLISLFAGTIAGYVIGRVLSISYIEVITGFLSFLIASLITLKRLRRIDSSVRLSVKKIEDACFSEDPGAYIYEPSAEEQKA
ncbi:MAG: SoxR reducing system RseC family protein [Thermodesulfovibrionales bacterium]